MAVPASAVSEQQQPGRAYARPRVWLLTNAPSPYQEELFREVHRRRDIDLDVRYLRGQSAAAPGAGANAGEVVPGFGLSRTRDELRFHPAAVKEAGAGRHDCYVLSGLYTSPTFRACAGRLASRGRPWALWLERPRSGSRRGPAGLSALRGRLRRAALGPLLRKATRVICIGTAAKEEYAAEYRLPDHKFLVLPYCCDTERFLYRDPASVSKLRAELGWEGRTVFLFSGQMIRRKGVDTALRAFELAAADRDAALLLIGDGPLRKDLEGSVPPGLRGRVRFAGFQRQADLPKFFAAADVFVFPSRHDGWAVVVNEACGAGLPVVATRQTGAARDLVVPGENGFVLESDDVPGFARAMRHFLDNPGDVARFGVRSLEMAKTVSVAAGADLLARHVREITACRQ